MTIVAQLNSEAIARGINYKIGFRIGLRNGDRFTPCYRIFPSRSEAERYGDVAYRPHRKSGMAEIIQVDEAANSRFVNNRALDCKVINYGV